MTKVQKKVHSLCRSSMQLVHSLLHLGARTAKTGDSETFQTRLNTLRPLNCITISLRKEDELLLNGNKSYRMFSLSLSLSQRQIIAQ